MVAILPTSQSKAMRPLFEDDGFTLIELLVVMVIIATLLSLVAPRYFHSVDKAKEATLRTDLHVMRDAIDKYLADTGKYPESLTALSDARYISAVPIDPETDSAETWVAVPYPDHSRPGIYDIRSGAQGTAIDGSNFSSW
jgi:general secretion pathway protein G